MGSARSSGDRSPPEPTGPAALRSRGTRAPAFDARPAAHAPFALAHLAAAAHRRCRRADARRDRSDPRDRARSGRAWAARRRRRRALHHRFADACPIACPASARGRVGSAWLGSHGRVRGRDARLARGPPDRAHRRVQCLRHVGGRRARTDRQRRSCGLADRSRQRHRQCSVRRSARRAPPRRPQLDWLVTSSELAHQPARDGTDAGLWPAGIQARSARLQSGARLFQQRAAGGCRFAPHPHADRPSAAARAQPLAQRADGAQSATRQPGDLGCRSRPRAALVRRRPNAMAQGGRIRRRRPLQSNRGHGDRRRRLGGRERGARRSLHRACQRGDRSRNWLAASTDGTDAVTGAQGRRQLVLDRQGSVHPEEPGSVFAVRLFVHSQRPKAHLFTSLRYPLGSAPSRTARDERNRGTEERHGRDRTGHGAENARSHGASVGWLQRRLSSHSRRIRDDGREGLVPSAQALCCHRGRAERRLDGIRHLAGRGTRSRRTSSHSDKT